METPTRPFTIGGETLAQTSSPGSQGKKVVSFKSSMFPSPPAHRTSFEGVQQQQRQQQYAPQAQPSQQSSSYASAMPRSTSAPNLLPPPSTASSSRQVSSYQSNTQVAFQSTQKQQPPSPRKPITRSAVAPVPVNARMALQARKAVLAKRLRINLVLLLAWYIVTESRLYHYAAREVIQLTPSARMPIIWILDRLLPLLLTYNASEAFLRIKYGAAFEDLVKAVPEAIAPAQQPVSTSSSSTPSRILPINTATYKSSPKTRPSTNILPLPGFSHVRNRSTVNDNKAPLPPASQQSTPQRLFRADAGATESPTSALKRALLASSGSPTSSPFKADLSSSASMPAGVADYGGGPAKESSSPRVQAYWARHEPMASNLHRSIHGSEDIDRLLGSDA